MRSPSCQPSAPSWLYILPTLTQGDWVDFNGWHFAVLMDKTPWSACTAAFLEEPFALGFGSCAVFGNSIFGGHTLHGGEDLPLANPVWLGDPVEGFSWSHRDSDHPFATLHALACRMVEVEAGCFLHCWLLPQEAPSSQDVMECFLELLTWAWIDDGVDAAV